MKTSKILPVVLLALFSVFLTSCNKTESDTITFSFKGDKRYYAESEAYVYLVTCREKDTSRIDDDTYYISSYQKNGKRNWEKEVPFQGEIFPLKDGRFFYADSKGRVCGYSEKGKLLWETAIEPDEPEDFWNSNYLLGENEELILNVLSSPSNETAYCSVNIDGEKTMSPVIQNLSTCYTHNYPLGGYITEGFDSQTRWVINRLRENFSIEWTYYTDMHNLDIQNIADDGRILFVEDLSGGAPYFLRELDAEGNLIHEREFSSTTVAAYFQDKVIVCDDTLTVLNPDFTICEAFEDTLQFPRIKAFDDTFFVYTWGSYAPYEAVVYKGYYKQYDENLQLIADQVFEESDRFLEIGENGRLYYWK